MNENKNCVHIDYLSFAKKGLTLQEICTELGLRHLQFLESRKGPSADYKTGLSFGGITLYHQGFDKEGVSRARGAKHSNESLLLVGTFWAKSLLRLMLM